MVIERLLPASVSVCEAYADAPDHRLFPEERAVVRRAVPRRVAEFATGRHCARRALARLGIAPVPIPRGAAGAPVWPEGVLGSITHCTGYRAAVVVPMAYADGIGIDAEPDAELPDGMLRAIAGAAELGRIAALTGRRPRVGWGRVLFSAKESVYKAVAAPRPGLRDTAVRCEMDFKDVDVDFGAGDGGFTARVPHACGLPGPPGPREVQGRWTAAHGLVLTSVFVPPAEGRATGSASQQHHSEFILPFDSVGAAFAAAPGEVNSRAR
ncbi:4'-phosphopantetheinyl transferase [Streptomyces sp. NPDC048603]|uniref:4'-phosphopantetheinyl transferase family protein n=1 Tax=Streptomyces sp. NPDC048603 TaxID=3365577 RepID=UPI0037154A90